MTTLVFSHDAQAVTSSSIIAQETDNQHKNVIELVRTYLADFEEFGRVAFETQPFETNGGTQKREVALLNEQQATLLITYMRNSEIVRAFKKRLVKAFYEFAGQTNAMPPYQQAATIVPVFVQAANAFGFTGNQATLSANRAINRFTGVNLLEAMGQTALASPDDQPLLTATDIALRLGIGKRETNPLLIDCELQTSHRDHKNRLYYELTEEGQKYGVMMDTDKKSGGAPIRQIKWSAAVLPILEARLQVESEHQGEAA